MTRVLVLNGPNLGRLGSREPEVYGSATYDELVATCEQAGREVGLAVEVRQTDDEAELVAWLHEAADAGVPVVLNPAAFTHYSYAVRDACAQLAGPLVEVHLTNPATREAFRHTSVVAGVATGTVSGFGLDSYRLAIRAIAAGTPAALVRVGLGTPDDVAAAIQVWDAAEEARRGAPVEPEEIAAMTARLRGGGWPVVAWDNDRAVGIAVGFQARMDDGASEEPVPGLAHLSLVMVRPEHWGQGIGGRLLDAAVAEARKRRFTRIQLWTHEHNSRGQRLYTSRAFARTGRTKVDDRGELIGLWTREL